MTVTIIDFTESASASLGASCGSATRYGRTEDILVLPIVIPEFKFRNIQGKVLGGNLVEGAHDAAFDQRPEAFDGVGMNSTDHVFAPAMAHNAVRVFGQPGVAGVLVGRQEIDLGAYGLTDEVLQGAPVGIADHASHDATVAGYGTGHDEFATSATAAGAFPAMFVLGLPAYIGFVSFHDAHKLAESGIDQTSTDTVAHIMGSLVRADPENALHFEGGNTLLAVRRLTLVFSKMVPTRTEKR